MPRGAPLPESQPESGAKPIVALRLKLKQFKDRLLFMKKHSDSPLPELPWQGGDLRDLDAVYMASHKREGTTRGKELLWVDGEYEGLRLFKTLGAMIAAVPLRPVAAIQRELLKIDSSYNPALHRLSLKDEAIARHKAMEAKSQRYRALYKLSSALKEPTNDINRVPVDEFKEVLRELAPDILPQLETGFELNRDERVERLISQTLFLDLCQGWMGLQLVEHSGKN